MSVLVGVGPSCDDIHFNNPVHHLLFSTAIGYCDIAKVGGADFVWIDNRDFQSCPLLDYSGRVLKRQAKLVGFTVVMGFREDHGDGRLLANNHRAVWCGFRLQLMEKNLLYQCLAAALFVEGYYGG